MPKKNPKMAVMELCQSDTDKYVELFRKRASEPAEGAVRCEVFFMGEPVACDESDCNGVVTLSRDMETMVLSDTASCLMCGRKYMVIEMEDYR